jgi:hypothetical protein
MHAPNPTVLKYADAHRHDLLDLAARYRFLDTTCQSAAPVSTAPSRPRWQLTLGSARHVAVSLVTVAFGKGTFAGSPR